jgi:hypothetical protein
VFLDVVSKFQAFKNRFLKRFFFLEKSLEPYTGEMDSA